MSHSASVPLVRVRVLSHRIVDGTHVMYRIRTREGVSEWCVERRWSELRCLYYELWEMWAAQLNRSNLPTPSFSHHAYRIGPRRLNAPLLHRREREMEDLLSFFSAALMVTLKDPGDIGPAVLRTFLTNEQGEVAATKTTHTHSVPVRPQRLQRRTFSSVTLAGATDSTIPVDPPFRGRTFLTPAELRAAVDAPTAAGHYYTPSNGWPGRLGVCSRRGRDECCQELLVKDRGGDNDGDGGSTKGSSGGDDERTKGDTVVGELFVEVLEAAGLPNMDTFSKTDAYVLVLFEGTVARTCTIDDDLVIIAHPRAPHTRCPLHAPTFAATPPYTHHLSHTYTACTLAGVVIDHAGPKMARDGTTSFPIANHPGAFDPLSCGDG